MCYMHVHIAAVIDIIHNPTKIFIIKIQNIRQIEFKL